MTGETAPAVHVEPASGLRGDVSVPGDKSISHRALLIGALADGRSEIQGFGGSADTLATASALRALGVSVDVDGERVRVDGVGLRGLRPPTDPIDCGNAGTLMRLLAGILAGQSARAELRGDESLSRRPLERIAEPLRRMGATIDTTDGHAPLHIEGGALQPIRYELPVASAQVKSCVLLAGLFAQGGPTEVVEPAPTRDHTERMLRSSGARITSRLGVARVWPADSLRSQSFEVPGDFSSAAPFLAATVLVPGSELRIHGVGINPTRIGFMHVLERMGARISSFNRRTVAGEPVADLEITSGELTATSVEAAEVPTLIDELPLFALVATRAHGASTLSGAEELRVKESDRIEATTDAVRAVGGRISSTRDGFSVRGVSRRLRGGLVDSRGDHRIAMLGALAGLASRDGVTVEGADWVAVSYPGFFEVLESLRMA